MTNTRLITLMLTLALVLAAAPAVVAQDESEAPEASQASEFDTTGFEAWEEEQALFLEHLEEAMLARGLAGQSVDAALAYLRETWGIMREAEPDDLAEAWVAANLIDEASDGELGLSQEEEPELGDEEVGAEEDGDGEAE